MEHFLLDGTFTDGWSAILFSSQEKAPRLPAFPQKLPQKDAAKAGGVGRPFFLQPNPEVCWAFGSPHNHSTKHCQHLRHGMASHRASLCWALFIKSNKLPIFISKAFLDSSALSFITHLAVENGLLLPWHPPLLPPKAPTQPLSHSAHLHRDFCSFSAHSHIATKQTRAHHTAVVCSHSTALKAVTPMNYSRHTFSRLSCIPVQHDSILVLVGQKDQAALWDHLCTTTFPALLSLPFNNSSIASRSLL